MLVTVWIAFHVRHLEFDQVFMAFRVTQLFPQ